jgi:hypothetical protein
MKRLFLSRHFHRLNIPGALLLAFLQRTPVARVLTQAETIIIESPVGNVLRSVLTAVASLGAIESMAGATPLVPTSGTAAGITVTTGTAVNVGYTVQGTQTPPASWTVSGTIPPGLNFSGLTGSGGTVNVTDLNLNGTPTTAGSYGVTITAWEGPNGTLIPSDPFSYTITVTGGSTDTAPSFTTQPQSQSVTAGTSVTFSAAAGGSPTPTYQWRKDGTAITGATNASFTINAAQTSDAGTYTVVATNRVTSTTSNPATLTVAAATSAPAFTTQPQSQSVTAGGSVTFTAAASGSPTPTFQWRKDGTALTGATNASLILNNVAVADAGSYTVVATNSVASVTSNAATLTVSLAVTPPAFTTQPQSQTVIAGGSALFSAVASGSPAPTYQWRRDGANLSDATTSSLALNNVSAADVGTYTVVASNSGGSVTSNPATLAIGSASNRGRIVNMSVLTSINAGEDFTFGYFLGGAGTTGTKPILMRAMGPTLGQPPFNIGGTLSDPFAEFFNVSTKVAENNDWSGDAAIRAAVTAVQAFPFASDTSKDAAIFAPNVDPSSAHSIKVSGVGGSAGTVIAELYDATPGDQFTAATPRLINVSLIKNVGAITTLGFYIDGSTSVKMLVRAIGPSIAVAPFNVPGAIADPKMALFSQGDPATPIATNDNWGGTADLKAAFTATNAFGIDDGSKDAAIVQVLQPGGYSVQVSPSSGATGTALIEVYEVP